MSKPKKPKKAKAPLSEKDQRTLVGNRLRKKYPQVEALVSAVALALRCGPYFKKSGTIGNLSAPGMPVRRWQEAFFDALDGMGIEYDRKAYYTNLDRKRR